jgi:hypothetical protein
VTAGKALLGAFSRSRRVSSREWAKNTPSPAYCTETAYCTDNEAGSRRPTKHSRWDLAGVQASAFNRGNGLVRRRPLTLRLTMFLALAVYERRTHPSGQAVCLLGLRRRRLSAFVAGLVLSVIGVGLLLPYAGIALATVIVALLLPGSLEALGARAGKKQLGRLMPSGQHRYLHSLASTLPGAGAELLREVTGEADRKGWTLSLDTSNEKLVSYYVKFDFSALGPAVPMPDGGCHVRMWRPATAREGEP